MRRKNLKDDIDLIAEDMQIDREKVKEAFIEALIAGCRKEHNVKTCRVEIADSEEELFVYTQKLVVDEISLEDKTMTHILLPEAKEIKSRIKVGDVLEEEVSAADFGFTAAAQVKNRFNEELNKLVKERQYEHFQALVGEVVPANVIGIDEAKGPYEKRYRLNIGQDMITILNLRDALPNDNLQIGDRINVLITRVDYNNRLRVRVSRTHPNLVKKLMANYIPEVKDGTVEIVSVARAPGDRSKVAVKTNDPNVDPIGACIGDAGIRIRGVTKALNNEKIDLFKWDENERQLIINSLQPAEVIAVTRINPVKKEALAIVKNDHLSLAIGKGGQNVRLAVQATGWSIDIKSEQMALDEGILY